MELSRFRFLLYGMAQVNHRVFVKLVYASAILHNMFVVHAADKVDYCLDDVAWQKFFKSFQSHRCPTCVREEKGHCVHMAGFRNGVAQQKRYRVAPSEMRNHMCESLWQQVCDGPNRDDVLERMAVRRHEQRDDV